MPILKNYNKKFKKVPIIIYQSFDIEYPGWRCEIADNFEDFKPTKFDDINFEDLGAHFNFDKVDHIESKFLVEYGFKSKSDALKAVKEIEAQINAKLQVILIITTKKTKIINLKEWFQRNNS